VPKIVVSRLNVEIKYHEEIKMSQNVVPELPEAENEFDEELVVKSQKRKRIAKKKLTVDDLTNTSKGLPALADKTFSSFKPSYRYLVIFDQVFYFTQILL